MDTLERSADPATQDRSHHSAAGSPLIIDGLVAVPRTVMPDDVASLRRVTCTEDFHCEHTGTTPGQVWQGIGLLDLIELAQPQPEAKYVRVHADNYSIPLAFAEIEGALLADSLNGQPLSPERGAPWRLYVPGAECHVSVKWVTRLEVTATRASTPEERIARARQRGRIAASAT